MDIVSAKESDIEDIHKLGSTEAQFQVNEETTLFWSKEVLQECITSNTGSILVAKEGSELIGFIIANYNPTFKKGILENILVKKEYRKQNIATKLIEEITSALENLGCEYICGHIEEENIPSQNLFVKSKFTKGNSFIWVDKILDSKFKK
jgi:ribosomal protein S18 acetylase RimI-like enzyme